MEVSIGRALLVKLSHRVLFSEGLAANFPTLAAGLPPVPQQGLRQSEGARIVSRGVNAWAHLAKNGTDF
jgi:hypothetical protein